MPGWFADVPALLGGVVSAAFFCLNVVRLMHWRSTGESGRTHLRIGTLVAVAAFGLSALLRWSTGAAEPSQLAWFAFVLAVPQALVDGGAVALSWWIAWRTREIDGA